jgi:hypothetical protein
MKPPAVKAIPMGTLPHMPHVMQSWLRLEWVIWDRYLAHLIQSGLAHQVRIY